MCKLVTVTCRESVWYFFERKRKETWVVKIFKEQLFTYVLLFSGGGVGGGRVSFFVIVFVPKTILRVQCFAYMPLLVVYWIFVRVGRWGGVKGEGGRGCLFVLFPKLIAIPQHICLGNSLTK